MQGVPEKNCTKFKAKGSDNVKMLAIEDGTPNTPLTQEIAAMQTCTSTPCSSGSTQDSAGMYEGHETEGPQHRTTG